MVIVYTDHATLRMLQRSIGKCQVESVLKFPDSKTLLNGKIKSIKNIDGRNIVVLYTKEDNDIIVITVYWGD